MSRSSRSVASGTVPILTGFTGGVVRTTWLTPLVFLSLVVSSCSSNDPASSPQGRAVTQSGAGGAAPDYTYTGGSSSTTGLPPSTTMTFTVTPEAKICQEDLLFKVPGCSCEPGTPEKACWTGPPNERHTGHCKDGVQKCLGKEIAQWGPCEGETLLCKYPPEHVDAGTHDAGTTDSGTPPPPPPPPPGCSCIPGKTIACDEDCQTLVICSLTGYKTCQPDGTWGPCHETTDLGGIVNNVLGCRNWLHGCLPGAEEGVYTGDCSQAFTCGHPPGAM
jgi:hypothetical protein